MLRDLSSGLHLLNRLIKGLLPVIQGTGKKFVRGDIQHDSRTTKLYRTTSGTL